MIVSNNQLSLFLMDLTVWSLRTHFEHWQHFQSVLLFLAAGQTKQHLPYRLPLPSFAVVGEVGCFLGTTITVMALRVCLSTFPLSTLFLISGFIISSPRDALDSSFFVAQGIFQHSQYKCIYTSNNHQTEE